MKRETMTTFHTRKLSYAFGGWLFEHAVDPLHTYRHKWQRHDGLMWDNRSTMHLALADFAPGVHRYYMRTTILGKPSGYLVSRSMSLDYRRHVACTGAAMTKWHFYKGVSNDWHWYQLDETGDVVASSDGAFDGLDACMRNARAAGFDETAFQVHTPAPGTGTQPRNPQNHA